MAIDSNRVYHDETGNTFTSEKLDKILGEIDSRLSSANCFPTITRTSGLISKIEYFSDVARSIKKAEVTFTRYNGNDGVKYIGGYTFIYYNDDTTEDSRVTGTLVRDVNENYITSCNNVFSTGETSPC